MDKERILDLVLERLIGDMDDMEGSAAMAHSADECPDPLGCKMHDSELGDSLTKDEPGMKGIPSLEGQSEEKAELSDDDAEELKKLLAK